MWEVLFSFLLDLFLLDSDFIFIREFIILIQISSRTP